MTGRWKAVVWYRTDAGLADVEHDIEELHELHDLVERGPDWNAIEKIEVYLNLSTGRRSIEEAILK